MSGAMADLGDRNRLLRRILLGIMAALVIASFLVGIRW
jgi:cell division protein ZapA (FtsZ GTPase activity inhibitor)